MREFTDGATAIARGAVDAGCTFFAGYPITPASQILQHMMREMPRAGGVAIQAEDEIASMGFCIGATFGGLRAMTATSGPGLSLYSENIGYAINAEVPLVIVDVQRLGPGTGAATTVGQGDVQFVRWGNGGGYPIIALAPSSVAECYAMTRRAFALAERFRVPVFVLTDKELNLTTQAVDLSDYDAPEVPPRRTWDEAQDGAFQPYRFVPGEPAAPIAHYGVHQLVRYTGSTHDENGVITKDPEKVQRLNTHLHSKIMDHMDEIELVVHDHEEGANTLFLSYGVTAGGMREAVRQARAAGAKVSSLTVQSLWPIPEMAIAKALKGMDRVVVAELNHGQYTREIERVAGEVDVVGLHRVDGRLISPEQYLETLEVTA